MKDESSAVINNTEINNCEYGLAVYQKKPDFGPAHVFANSVNIKDSYLDYIVEDNSTLLMDTSEISEKDKNIYSKLYENF